MPAIRGSEARGDPAFRQVSDIDTRDIVRVQAVSQRQGPARTLLHEWYALG